MSEHQKTAYEQSLDAARALMTAAQAGQAEIERKNAEDAAIKRAFRIAYEYLCEMMPPMNTQDYWTLAADRANAKCGADADMLTRKLMIAVFNWLEWRAKQ